MEEKPTYSLIVGDKAQSKEGKPSDQTGQRLEGSGGSLDPGTHSLLSPWCRAEADPPNQRPDGRCQEEQRSSLPLSPAQAINQR